MTRWRSLSFRLTAYLFFALLFGSSTFWGGLSLWSLFESGSANIFAHEAVHKLVIESLNRAPDGSATIVPSPALRAQIQRNPTLAYAACDTKNGAALIGSSPELAATLSRLATTQIGTNRVKLLSLHVNFDIIGDHRPGVSGLAQEVDTPVGRLLVVTYGEQFEWTDLISFASDTLETIFYLNGLAIALAMLVIWLAVRRGLAPLQAAAENARAINMESLGRRLPESDLPNEVEPFVRAVNDALERLSEGVARQRRFVANAAHQLCTPIAILRARVDDPHDDGLRRDLRRDLRQLQAIVEQLLVSARLTERGGKETELLDFAKVVRSKVADYAPLVRENGRDIEFEGPSSAVMLRGDRRALESVIANLVDNALRAEPRGGAIIVRLTASAALEVVDHGEGVAQSDREMIFEPFWRKSEARPGTGLGLAIAKEIVELHSGKIWVEDTPGGGATFKVAFPKANSN